MIRFPSILLVLVASSAYFFFPVGSTYLTPNSGPLEDGLDWIDNTLVPEPGEEGASRWYAPSRKAHLFADNHKRKLRNQLMRSFTKADEENLRLPTNVLPYRYSIQLIPFLEEGNFTTDGNVLIFVDCLRATDSITLNSAAIDIDRSSITVYDITTETYLNVKNFVDEQLTREMITIQLTSSLQLRKQYRISIKFISFLNDELRGFYRSSYFENGVKKWLAISDFESPNARRAFPCFDEPSMKAEFTVTLGRKQSMRSASNMPQIGSSSPIAGLPGYFWDYYQTSVLMPTYIVTFLVSEFVPVSAPSGLNRVPFRIWTRPDYVNYTNYANEKAPRIQKRFEEYFEVQYPLPKQDSAAIPDFAAGAMENWGLVTYREIYLLINPATATRTDYQNVASINAHELAHMWFGDLVTLAWWNVLWLNEGFATYFETLGTAAVEPEWRMEEQFLTYYLHYVFGIDGLETSRPMNTPVVTNDDMSAMFDAISYDKAGCVINMMADFLGEETFRKGLKRYLQANAFGNVFEDDLWTALQQQAVQDNVTLPAPMKEIMSTWTLQMGYPLVTVTRDYTSNTTLISQERFLLRKTEGINDTHVYRWWVPLTYKLENQLDRHADWLAPTEPNKTITIDGLARDDFLLFNVDQQNYYRVAYDAVNYGLLANKLVKSHNVISIRNRAQILDDAFNLALANVIPYKHALDLSVYLEHEREYVPWRAALTELDYIDIMLRRVVQFSDWKSYMTRLVTPYYNHVGFEELDVNAHIRIYSRADALNWACRLEVPDCIKEVKTRYSELMIRPNMYLSPNQRNFILRVGVESGAKAEWDFAFAQYKATGSTAFLIAMANTKQTNIVYDMLNMIIDSTSGIRIEHVNTLFANIAATPVGNPMAFDFLINRWTDIEKSWLGKSYFISFYYSLRSRLNTQADLQKYMKLRDDHLDVLGSSNNVLNAINTVMNNVRWMELHQQEVGDWLKAFLNPTSPATECTSTTPSTTTAPSTTASTTTPPSTTVTLLTTIQSSTATSPTTTSPTTTMTSTTTTPSTNTTVSTASSTQRSTAASTSLGSTAPSGANTVRGYAFVMLMTAFVCHLVSNNFSGS